MEEIQMNSTVKDNPLELCRHCLKELDEKYIINPNGELYCGEECLDYLSDINDISYDPHPYEDQYMGIRRDYIDLLENWELTLSSVENNLKCKIDEIIDDYYEFFQSEGDDGIYAQEIYQYIWKLKDLQQKILAWRPNRKTYYWLSTDLGLNAKYGSTDTPHDEMMYDKITVALYLDGYGEDLQDIIKNHAHPIHWGCNLVFNNNEDATEVYEVFKPYFERYDQEIRIIESHRCEAIYCEDIADKSDESLYLNGFFYCNTHTDCGEHGIYSEEELTQEFNYYVENEGRRQVVMEGIDDWCYPFKEKMKRSYRSHSVDIPTWAL
jgi:hypothetical protein